MKKKKATIIPKNDDNKCFQYVATVTLNHEKSESHSEGVSNIKPFINNNNNNNNWEVMNHSSIIEYCKRFDVLYTI